jgi:putative heme degradation protein
MEYETMTETPNPRERLTARTEDVLASLPAMGRVMLSARGGGATHERIGTVERVAVEDGAIVLSGAAHDSRLDLAAIAGLVADRTSKMRDKALPRLECQDAAGETLYSLIALDGPELFEQALAPFGPGEALEPKEKPAPSAGGEKPEVPEGDLGAVSFAAIRATGTPVTVELRRPDLHQLWQGVLPEAKPAMGFVNLMEADFHLHLKAGAVARWLRREVPAGVELHGEDAEGAPLGLVLAGPAAAFADVPGIAA